MIFTFNQGCCRHSAAVRRFLQQLKMHNSYSTIKNHNASWTNVDTGSKQLRQNYAKSATWWMNSVAIGRGECPDPQAGLQVYV